MLEIRPPFAVSTQAVLGDPLFDLPQPIEVSRDLSAPQLAVIVDDLRRQVIVLDRHVALLDQVVADLQARTLAARWHRFIFWCRQQWSRLWR